MRLEGKTAIVTGAGSGFGAGIARRFLAEGARVMVADINEKAAMAVAEEFGGLGHPVDVADGASVSAMIERATDYWGVGVAFFSAAGMPGADWFELFLGTFLLLLLFASVGGATAAVYVRWKASGMYVFWAGLVVLLVADEPDAVLNDLLPFAGDKLRPHDLCQYTDLRGTLG